MERDADPGFRVTDRRGHRDEPSPVAPPSGEAPAAAEPQLSTLFIMLGSLALAAMGEGPTPPGERPTRDLSQAAECVGLLMVLRDKTDGHRTAEESRMLDDLIYDLQLRYVEATKRAHAG